MTYMIGQIGTDMIRVLGEVLSNPWWAAVLLGIMIILHFMRDAAIEKRFSRLLEKRAEADEANASAHLKQAQAMQGMSDRIERLEDTVFRKLEVVEEAVISNGTEVMD